MLKAFNNKSTYASLGLFILTILLSSILVSPPSSAETTTVDASVNVPVSCSLSGAGMNSHNADVPNGTYQADIGITTLKAMCNDSEGFAIYAIGFTGDQYLGDDHTKLIGTSTNQKITTSTATSGNTSSWAMKLAAVSSPTPVYPITLDNGYGSYSSIPDTYTKVAHRDSGTDVGTNATGAQLTTTYASFISSTQVADNYSGKVKYTLVHPANETPLVPVLCESGKICYNSNGSNVIGTMGSQTIYSTSTSITLLASNYSRKGYGFAGWSNKFDYATNPNQEGIKFYGPNETIYFTNEQYRGEAGTYNGLSLYAVWIPSAGSLQDSTKVTELCGAGANALTAAPYDGTANLSSVSALTDQRDNETYAIAKLADGKCWMIENLRLENTNSDNRIGNLAQGYGANFEGLAEPEPTSPFNTSPTANSLYSKDGSNDTIDIGADGYTYPRYNNWNNQSNSENRPQSPASNDALNATTKAGIYSYGNYYTWSAATAIAGSRLPVERATTSICPTGWRIPQGNTASAGFGKLDVDMGGTGESNQNTAEASNRWRKYPTNIILAGIFSYQGANRKGSDAYYWSSTSGRGDAAYMLSLISTSVHPVGVNTYKYQGISIRCTVEP